MSMKIKRWMHLDECPVACCQCPDHKITAWSPIFAAVGARCPPPLLRQSLEKQEVAGRHHPLLTVPSPEHPLESVGACRESLKHGLAGSSSVPPAQEQTRLPLEVWPAAFLQTVGRRGKTTPFFLALPIWQGLAPPKRCSALERSHTQLCLTSPNLTVCAVDPCRIPSVPILLDFGPRKKSCSGFSELMRISLTQNCCFLGSSDTVRLVWGFFPPL